MWVGRWNKAESDPIADIKVMKAIIEKDRGYREPVPILQAHFNKIATIIKKWKEEKDGK